MKNLPKRTLLIVFCLWPVLSVGCRHLSKTDDASIPDVDPAEAQLENRRQLGYALASSLESQGKSEEAIQLYKRLAKRTGQSTPWHRLALIYAKQEDFTKAMEYYLRALELEPDNIDLLADYGYSCYLASDLGQAESTLRRAVELQPSHQRANNNLGLLFARLDMPERAIESFRAAGCDESQIYANLGVAAFVKGDADVSKRFLQHALSLNPRLASTQELLAAIESNAITPDPQFPRTPQLVGDSPNQPSTRWIEQGVVLTGHQE